MNTRRQKENALFSQPELSQIIRKSNHYSISRTGTFTAATKLSPVFVFLY